jgi:hypothetical protein
MHLLQRSEMATAPKSASITGAPSREDGPIASHPPPAMQPEGTQSVKDTPAAAGTAPTTTAANPNSPPNFVSTIIADVSPPFASAEAVIQGAPEERRTTKHITNQTVTRRATQPRLTHPSSTTFTRMTAGITPSARASMCSRMTNRSRSGSICSTTSSSLDLGRGLGNWYGNILHLF